MRPLILSGPPRSGTTLFSALLDGHSEINWFIDEGFFFEHLYKIGAANFPIFVKSALLSADGLVEGLRDRFIMPPTDVTSDFPSLTIAWSEENFRQVLENAIAETPRDLWGILRDAYMAGFGYQPRRFVSMKAADYGRSVFGALEYFPEARGVIIVRDPVAAFNSLKVYRQKAGRRLLTWPTLTEAIIDLNTIAARVDRYDDARMKIVRFEDFAEKPEPVMRSFCDWLGLAFDPVLTKPSMMGAPWSNNSSFTDQPSGVDPLPARRNALTAEERDFIYEATAPFRNRFGYGRR